MLISVYILCNRFPIVFVLGLNLAKIRPTSLIWTEYTISSLVLLLGLTSRFPTNELRVDTIAQKSLRIEYDSVTMSKNPLGIRYESRTIFRIGEFVAKVLNSSKLLTRIPDRPTNCKN